MTPERVPTYLIHEPIEQSWAWQSCPSREEVSVDRVILCHFSCAFLFHVHLLSDKTTAWEQNLLFTDLKPNTWLSKARSWLPISFGKCWLMLSLLHVLHAESLVSPAPSIKLSMRRKLTGLHFPSRSSRNSAPQEQQPAGCSHTAASRKTFLCTHRPLRARGSQCSHKPESRQRERP